MEKKKKFPIYRRYLKVRFEKPMTLVGAALMPYLQAMIGSMLQIYITDNNLPYTFIGGLFYWSMFALNGKRIALGGWKAITLFILFATFGTLTGVLLLK